MALQICGKYRWKVPVQRRRQARVRASRRDVDAVIGIGELYRVDQAGTNGRSQLADDRLGLLCPIALQLRKRIITPITSTGSRVNPRVLRVAESQHMSLGQVIVAADILLAIIQMRSGECLPVIAPIRTRSGRTLASRCGRAVEVRQRELAHLIGDPLEGLGNRPRVRTLQSCRERIDDGVTTGDIVEIATAFGGWRLLVSPPTFGRVGYASGARYAANFPVPFLAPEEEQFILLDGTAQGVAEVIAPKNRLVLVGIGVDAARAGMHHVSEPVLSCLSRGEPVISIQSVIATRVEEATMPIVGSVFGHDVDDCARGLAVFRTVGIA